MPVSETLSRAEQRLALLRELADIGMGLARGVAAEAAETGDGRIGDADLALTFARVSRAVRQTLALEVRFEQEALTLRTRVLGATGARVKRQAARGVSDAIEADFSSDFEADRQLADLHERLADEDDCDFVGKPLAQIVERLCREIGVRFDPDLWEEAEAADPPRPEERGALPLISPKAGTEMEALGGEFQELGDHPFGPGALESRVRGQGSG